MINTIVLVGCGKSKSPETRAARDLYTGQLFRARRQYAENSGSPWMILSAKHGLISPDRVTEPYDCRLTAAAGHAWAASVFPALLEQAHALGFITPGTHAKFGEFCEVEFHAGSDYVLPLLTFLEAVPVHLNSSPWRVRWHVKGLGIGQQLRWYSDKEAERLKRRSEQRRHEQFMAAYHSRRRLEHMELHLLQEAA